MVRVGDTLPRLSFRQVDRPGSISWSQGQLASVIMVPHGYPCDDCAHYAEALATAADGLSEWATRALVLVGTAPVATTGLYLLADDGGGGRAQLGVSEAQAAVVQCDRWGAVYQVEVVGSGAAGHRLFPAPRDLVALAQFIDIQCPECGIPSREWLGATAFPLG